MNNVVSLVGGLGIGALVASLLQSWWSARQAERSLAFAARQKAYSGLWSAVGKLEIENSKENGNSYGYWSVQVRLVGSPNVVGTLARAEDTKPRTPDRRKAIDELVQAMRADLGIR